jgi:hypothetical protein
VGLLMWDGFLWQGRGLLLDLRGSLQRSFGWGLLDWFVLFAFGGCGARDCDWFRVNTGNRRVSISVPGCRRAIGDVWCAPIYGQVPVMGALVRLYMI